MLKGSGLVMAGLWQALVARVILRSNCEARSVFLPSSCVGTSPPGQGKPGRSQVKSHITGSGAVIDCC